MQGARYNSPNTPGSPDGGNSVAVEAGHGDLSSRADEPSGVRSSVNLNPSKSRAQGSHSRVRQGDDPDFRRGPQPQQGRRLWTPDDLTTKSPEKNLIIPEAFRIGYDEDRPRTMLKQPPTRIISQEHLINEVKGIYAGLMLVETKCIEVDNVQALNLNTKLNDEQWHALVALHRTLLHEHHDFFLASQHPAASIALQRLAAKYAMPARMWRHGIHSFLELLRHRLPYSLEHMQSFIYLSYGIVTLLYETVPAFTDIWIECLGDLGRYRYEQMCDHTWGCDTSLLTLMNIEWPSKTMISKTGSTGLLFLESGMRWLPTGRRRLDAFTTTWPSWLDRMCLSSSSSTGKHW